MRSVLFLLLIGAGGVCGQATKVKVEPAGLGLVWDKGGESFENAMILNMSEPVSLALLVQADGKKIVALNRDASKVRALSDDTGTDLGGELGHFPKIAEDGSALLLEVTGNKRVAGRATAVIAAGELALEVAGKTATKRSKVVAVAKGAKVALAEELVFEIAEAGKPDWGDDPFAVSLSIKRDIPEVAAIRFLDGEGKVIESSPSGSSRGGFFGKVTVTRDFNLKRKVDEIVVEVDVWTDLEELTVPFEVKAGIGGATE